MNPLLNKNNPDQVIDKDLNKDLNNDLKKKVCYNILLNNHRDKIASEINVERKKINEED